MSPRHFSRYGGPYFINDGYSKHTDEHHDHSHTRVSTIARIKSFFKSRFKSRPSDQK
jgi:hypothetical protein